MKAVYLIETPSGEYESDIETRNQKKATLSFVIVCVNIIRVLCLFLFSWSFFVYTLYVSCPLPFQHAHPIAFAQTKVSRSALLLSFKGMT